MQAADYRKRIGAIERAKSSVNGNPAWWITFDDYERVRTSSDAAVSYEIGNPGFRAGDLVDVYLTRSGRIAYMTAVQS